MKSHARANKANPKNIATPERFSSAGEKSIALAPPAYGIEFVDHATAAAGPVQRVGKMEEEEPLKAKPQTAQRIPQPGKDRESQELPGKFDTSTIARAEAGPVPHRTSLPEGLKAGIESLSGLDMSKVRVHANSARPAQLNALAYAQGNEIHLAPGQEKHLPHEAWHVVQQRQGRVKPTFQAKGIAINDDRGLEREADLMAGHAARVIHKAGEKEGRVQGKTSAANNAGMDSPIQMYKWTYGALNNESGTEIKTDLITPGDTSGGSNVSAWPSWWPAGAAETANDFLRENFVQGHLLNEKLGGPGNQRYNLTPLTRSANSQMSASIENPAKYYLKQNQAIKYWVAADYKSHPNVTDVGAGHLNFVEQAKLQTQLNKMPGQVGAQITVHDFDHWSKTWKELPKSQQPKDIYVKNEGAALKGSFV